MLIKSQYIVTFFFSAVDNTDPPTREEEQEENPWALKWQELITEKNWLTLFFPFYLKSSKHIIDKLRKNSFYSHFCNFAVTKQCSQWKEKQGRWYGVIVHFLLTVLLVIPTIPFFVSIFMCPVILENVWREGEPM